MNEEKNITDDFVSTLSHEIRTPLTSIKGFAKTLYDNFDDLTDEQKKKFLQIISEQSQRLINLVENVLNVAKLDANADDVILREVDLVRVLNSVLEVLKMNYKNHSFKLNFSKNLPSSLADSDKLEQILTNIIENACKYSHDNSEILINIFNKNSKNVVEIINFGEGISEENLTKIFDKFYRAGNSLTNKAQGSGLGLYIAKTLAKKIGAEIEVESYKIEKNEDKNLQNNEFLTKFSIFLPIFEVEEITKHISKDKNSEA